MAETVVLDETLAEPNLGSNCSSIGRRWSTCGSTRCSSSSLWWEGRHPASEPACEMYEYAAYIPLSLGTRASAEGMIAHMYIVYRMYAPRCPRLARLVASARSRPSRREPPLQLINELSLDQVASSIRACTSARRQVVVLLLHRQHSSGAPVRWVHTRSIQYMDVSAPSRPARQAVQAIDRTRTPALAAPDRRPYSRSTVPDMGGGSTERCGLLLLFHFLALLPVVPLACLACFQYKPPTS